jgi:hypothetical protein
MVPELCDDTPNQCTGLSLYAASLAFARAGNVQDLNAVPTHPLHDRF